MLKFLASVFVLVVASTSVLYPQANIPEALGVELQNTAQVETQIVNTGEQATTTVRTRINSFNADQTLEQAQQEREQIRQEIEARHQEAIQNMEQKREEFRLRLQEIQNERKRKVVERIDQRLSEINQKKVEHWNEVLSRLSQILVKIQSRMEKMAELGKDVSGVQAAITAAEQAIASAQDLVNAQASKEYVLEIGEEVNLGQDIKGTIDQFHQDLRTVWEGVKAAREAVQDAILSLANSVENEE